jgi:diaminopimelate decarboxylase
MFLSRDKLKAVADTFGTPTYCYDENIIEQKCQNLNRLFPDLPVKWLYAIKANDNPFILEIIHAQGFGFDTVSFEEVVLSQYFHEDPHNIFYTENNMTDQEMEQAIEAGVILNIGSYSRLESYCKHPDTKRCSIRINPDIGDGHHERVVTGNKDSKFGIRFDLVDDCLKLAKKYDVKITGIHIHIGSGIKKPHNFTAAMKKLLNISYRFPDLEMVNFGGGFPIPYKESGKEFSLEDFKEQVTNLLEKDIENRQKTITYYFEPGRYIVGQSGVLLTRVNTVKNQGRKVFLGTDTGFNHLIRPLLYNAYHNVINIDRMDEPATETYTVSGNICESGDVLADNRILPKTKEGDILALTEAGAYGMTMASEYNRRAYPAEVLIQKNGELKLIRPRVSAEETVKQFFNDTGYKP